MNVISQLHGRHTASIARYLGGTGAALWALLVALDPDVGFAAPWTWMAVFWALQISSGLVVLQSVLFLLTRIDQLRQWPLWLLVISSGLLGSVFLSPIYWLMGEGLMEQLLGFSPRVDIPEVEAGPLSSPIGLLLNEFVDIVVPVSTAWFLISWPRLQRLVPPLLNEQAPTNLNQSETIHVIDPSLSIQMPAWRTRLAKELGDELIAVSSELQYLRVWTTRGSALVLGALQEVEDQEGTPGVRTHRSWWVNSRFVVRVRGKSDGAVCEMSNGLEVPVSRRKKAEVLARFGNHARYNLASKT